MDPLTIAASAARVSEKAYELYDFIQRARNVDETIRGLQTEIKQVADICGAVDRKIRLLDEPYLAQENELLQVLHAQIAGCVSAVSKIEANVGGNSGNRSNIIRQATRQIRLNLNQSNIDESRKQIQSHVQNLQVSLLLVNIKASHLAPQIANLPLLHKLNELQLSLNSQQWMLDNVLRAHANDYLTKGTLLYAKSLASHSETGESIEEQRNAIEDWMSQVDELDLKDDQTTVLGTPRISASLSRVDVSGLDLSDRRALKDTSTILPDVSHTTPSQSDGKSGPLDPVPYIEDGHDLDIERQILKATVEEASRNLRDRQYSKARQFSKDFIVLCRSLSNIKPYNSRLLKSILEAAGKEFQQKQYSEARKLYEDYFTLCAELPDIQPCSNELLEIVLPAAICAFLVRPPQEAEAILSSTFSKLEGAPQAETGILLACTLVRLNNLGKALSVAEDIFRARTMALDKDKNKRFEIRALLAHINDLLKSSTRADTYRSMVPVRKRSRFWPMFRNIQPNGLVSNPMHEPDAKKYENCIPEILRGGDFKPNTFWFSSSYKAEITALAWRTH